jgi:hypothetical protein
MSLGMPLEETYPLAPLRYTVMAAKCDCCDEVSVHLACGANRGEPILDIQFDRSDIPELIRQLQAAYDTDDIEGAIGGTTVTPVTWTATYTHRHPRAGS